MQRTEHQVARLGTGQRQADRLKVAQLADENDIRVFAQRGAQRFVEAERITMHLALVDQRFLGLVYEFDRIFDRQNMIRLILIDVVDHRGQRRRFTRPGRSGDEHDTARMHRNVLENRWRAQIVERQYFRRNRTKHSGRTAVLIEGVDAKTCQLRYLKREIGLQKLFVVLALLVIHDVVHHAIDVFVGQRRHIDTLDVAIDANHWRHSTRQVQVRGVVLYRERQELGNVDGHNGPFFSNSGLTITRRSSEPSITKQPDQNVTGFTENLKLISDLLAASADSAGRSPDAVRLLAVSKKQPLDRILAAAAAGQRDFGENFVQEGVEKIERCRHLNLVWHFIGHLQSNKTRWVAEYFDWVHTIDNTKTARRLSRQRDPRRTPLNVCLQVNVDVEPSKSGIAPEATLELARAVYDLPNLKLRGLMCLPAVRGEFEAQRKPFAHLRKLAESLRNEGIDIDTLSMGMSADFAAAIAEGATIVRIGTALFGKRDS